MPLEATNEWIVNTTTVNIPLPVRRIACLGKKFSLPTNSKNFPVHQLIADFESNINYINVNDSNIARLKFANYLDSASKSREPILNDFQMQVKNDLTFRKRFLRDNNDIFLTKADKGNVTVVLDKPLYIEKVLSMLSDKSTYTQLKKNNLREAK